MKTYLLLFSLLTTSFSLAQTMRPIDKVYILEGVVADKQTLKPTPDAVLYNDSLGLMTTSDGKGYFKLVVPVALIEKRPMIRIDIVKSGYKRDGTAFGYHPAIADTVELAGFAVEIRNADVKIFWMAKTESVVSSGAGTSDRPRQAAYGAAAVQEIFERGVTSERSNRKLKQLKQGNEKVFFLIDGKAVFAYSNNGYVSFDNVPLVFVNNKKVGLAEINKILKRDKVWQDEEAGLAFSKQYGRAAIAFRPYSDSDNDPKNQAVAEAGPPDYKDGGKTVDSLKKVYDCESIDYKNWDNKKVIDSCLTVRLINSTKVPSTGNIEESGRQLKAIATAIKKSLLLPQAYKSFYIIFIKRENTNGMKSEVHSNGMEIRSKELKYGL
jgi:hypothetical protein